MLHTKKDVSVCVCRVIDEKLSDLIHARAMNVWFNPKRARIVVKTPLIS